MPTTTSANEFDFDSLEVIEIPVKMGGETYTLREASGDAAFKYRNMAMKCTKLGPDGKPSAVENIADIEPFLLSQCLFDSKNKLVPIAKIRTWGNRTCQKLYAKVLEISELGADEDTESLEKQLKEIQAKLDKLKAKDEDSLGNEPSDTETGSD